MSLKPADPLLFGQQQALIDWQELKQFLQAIGRSAGPLVLALFPPDPSKPCIHFPCDAEAMPWQEIEATQRRKPELALGLVMNHALQRPADWGSKPEHLNKSGNPKAWGASDSHISQAIGIWGECDGGLSIEAQQALPGIAGLPEPTMTVWTGGKSLHLYWLLEPGELLEPGQFRKLQQRLAQALANASPAAGADRSIHNPARLMRVPGGMHPATGNRCSIHGGSGQRFTVAALLAMLPAPEPATAQRPGPQQQARPQEAYRLHELLPKELERLALEGADKGGDHGRNNSAFKLAAAAWGIAPAAAAAGLRVDGSPESLVLDFAARCRPPLEEREALACIASAQSRNPKPDAGWPERLRFHLNRAHQRPKPTLPMNGEAFIPADGPSNGAAPWGEGKTAAEQPAGRQRQQQPVKSKVVPGPKSGDSGPSAQSERVHQANQQEPAPKTKENQGEEINLASFRSDWLPLVMQHVFMPNGERWVSVENVLHQWTGTHYGSVADLELAPKVAKFLGRLSYYDDKMGEDVHEWARPARVDEAIRWLKRQTAASIEDFNPANALNLQNGVLSWSWEDQKLVTRLDPHDPEQRFTYCQGYGYDPHASRDTLEKLLKAVEESEQETFQRVMGSGLELARYRAIQGRPRAILAIGDGQNGKDTLQGAMSETLGNRGFTHCSIGDFQQYDKGRKFPLAPLYGSRINWSSENTGYARLETIQSLKTAITGERMSYEVKNVQEIPYSPNTLLIFNCNDAPRLDASSAAMESRWHVMAFRKRFTSRPDPSKPNELQADPRLKDDHQFIREAVCPAMLNWLLEGLQLAVSEGISYNPDSEALEAVRRQSCHLFDFVDDVGLAADPAGQVEASYVFELMWNWYQDQRILHLDPSTKRPTWNTHDLGGDHPVKIPRDLKARLRAVFPELRSERGTDKSRRSVLKGVRFVSSETNGGGTGASAGGMAEAWRRQGRRHEVQ